MRTTTIKQQIVIAPGFEIAFVRIYPYKKLVTRDNRRQDLQKQKSEISRWQRLQGIWTIAARRWTTNDTSISWKDGNVC